MTTRPVHVLVCDDHPLFRAGVISCLAGLPGVEVVAEASDGESCIAKLKIFAPHILIADLSTPGLDGFEVLEWVTSNMPETRVFILSMHTELEFVSRARQLGAAGFLAKEDAHTELVAAVLGQADRFYASTSAGRTGAGLVALPDKELTEALRKVSDAEFRVLALLTESATSREIGTRLNISPRTVQTHRVSLSEKLDCKGPNKLLEVAIRNRKIILESRERRL